MSLYYIEAYSGKYSQPHHSVGEEMIIRGAMDAVYAAEHPDLTPPLVAYIYDESSDEDGVCFSWLLISRRPLHVELEVEGSRISSHHKALVEARHAVKEALEFHKAERYA